MNYYLVYNTLFETKDQVKEETNRIVNKIFNDIQPTIEEVKFIIDLCFNDDEFVELKTMGYKINQFNKKILVINDIDINLNKSYKSLRKEFRLYKQPGVEYDFKIWFGKYKGKKISTVYKNDPQYLEWLKNQMEENEETEKDLYQDITSYLLARELEL